MTQGFYKNNGYELLYAPNFVEMPNIILIAEEKDSYEYPVNGWVWANSEDEAVSLLGGVREKPSTDFFVQPEGFALKTSKYDENEFSKLITLTQLALASNKIKMETELMIFDSSGNPRRLSVERFLKIMFDYGMFCYQNRN